LQVWRQVLSVARNQGGTRRAQIAATQSGSASLRAAVCLTGFCRPEVGPMLWPDGRSCFSCRRHMDQPVVIGNISDPAAAAIRRKVKARWRGRGLFRQ